MEEVYINLSDKITDKQYIAVDSVKVVRDTIVVGYHICDKSEQKLNKYNLQPDNIYKVILTDDEEDPIGDTWYMRFSGISQGGQLMCKSCFSLGVDREYIDYSCLYQSMMCDETDVVSVEPATPQEIVAYEYLEKYYKGRHNPRIEEKWSEIICIANKPKQA